MGVLGVPFGIKSNRIFLGIPCLRGEIEESTAVGAAILASYGPGEFPDLAKAAEEMANMKFSWKPDPTATAQYSKLFPLVEKLYTTLQDAHLYAELAASMKTLNPPSK